MPSAIVKERPRSTFPKGFLAIRTMFFLTHKVEHLTSALPVRCMLWVVTFLSFGRLTWICWGSGASTDPPGIPQRCCSSPPKVDEASSPQHSSLFRQMHGWPTSWANGISPKWLRKIGKRIQLHETPCRPFQKDWACWVDLVMVCLQVGWLMASRNAACFGVLFVAELRVKSRLDLDAQKPLLAGLPFPNYQ